MIKEFSRPYWRPLCLLAMVMVAACGGETTHHGTAPAPFDGHWAGEAMEVGPAGSLIMYVDTHIVASSFPFYGCGTVVLELDHAIGGCGAGTYIEVDGQLQLHFNYSVFHVDLPLIQLP